MPHQHRAPETELFWDIAEPFLAVDDTDLGTLMRFPCLRANGAFFATCDHRSGNLIVKLPRQRVTDLIEQGLGEPFSPAGRTFKEWILVRDRDPERWQQHISEARIYALGEPA